MKRGCYHHEKDVVVGSVVTGIISRCAAATAQKQYSLKLLVGAGEC